LVSAVKSIDTYTTIPYTYFERLFTFAYSCERSGKLLTIFHCNSCNAIYKKKKAPTAQPRNRLALILSIRSMEYELTNEFQI